MCNTANVVIFPGSFVEPTQSRLVLVLARAGSVRYQYDVKSLQIAYCYRVKAGRQADTQ